MKRLFHRRPSLSLSITIFYRSESPSQVFLIMLSYLHAKAKQVPICDVENTMRKQILCYDNMCHVDGMKVRMYIFQFQYLALVTGTPSILHWNYRKGITSWDEYKIIKKKYVRTSQLYWFKGNTNKQTESKAIFTYFFKE